MKLAGKHTKEVANRILESFQQPENLPKALSLACVKKFL